MHAGQHFDHAMSGQFFDELHLPNPSYNLEIDSLPREEMIAKMVRELLKVIIDENPDLIVVYGDTNSTLAGALAANVRQIPVAHIGEGNTVDIIFSKISDFLSSSIDTLD